MENNTLSWFSTWWFDIVPHGVLCIIWGAAGALRTRRGRGIQIVCDPRVAVSLAIPQFPASSFSLSKIFLSIHFLGLGDFIFHALSCKRGVWPKSGIFANNDNQDAIWFTILASWILGGSAWLWLPGWTAEAGDGERRSVTVWQL